MKQLLYFLHLPVLYNYNWKYDSNLYIMELLLSMHYGTSLQTEVSHIIYVND